MHEAVGVHVVARRQVDEDAGTPAGAVGKGRTSAAGIEVEILQSTTTRPSLGRVFAPDVVLAADLDARGIGHRSAAELPGRVAMYDGVECGQRGRALEAPRGEQVVREVRLIERGVVGRVARALDVRVRRHGVGKRRPVAARTATRMVTHRLPVEVQVASVVEPVRHQALALETAEAEQRAQAPVVETRTVLLQAP